jgi:hypothetical protein
MTGFEQAVLKVESRLFVSLADIEHRRYREKHPEDICCDDGILTSN